MNKPNPETYQLSSYQFELPRDLIAQYPVEPRDSCRLLVVDRQTGQFHDSYFTDLPAYLTPGDALVLNETRVIPARLFGEKETGARVEILLLKKTTGACWEALVRPARRLLTGTRVYFTGSPVEAEILEVLDLPGGRIVRFHNCSDEESFINQYGRMPLPPYIDREADGEDNQRYQTVFANCSGSAAAPTAGLHFTPGLLQSIAAQGVNINRLLLHVGLGTFRPVAVEDIRQHRMHSEYYEVGSSTAEQLNNTRQQGNKILAVGTTVVRTLETICQPDGKFIAGQGETSKFIYPGYQYKAVDGLLTNFHLPGSSLIMLVAAFAGLDLTMEAYQHAVQERYRFFSYGDAMLII